MGTVGEYAAIQRIVVADTKTQGRAAADTAIIHMSSVMHKRAAIIRIRAFLRNNNISKVKMTDYYSQQEQAKARALTRYGGYLKEAKHIDGYRVTNRSGAPLLQTYKGDNNWQTEKVGDSQLKPFFKTRAEREQQAGGQAAAHKQPQQQPHQQPGREPEQHAVAGSPSASQCPPLAGVKGYLATLHQQTGTAVTGSAAEHGAARSTGAISKINQRGSSRPSNPNPPLTDPNNLAVREAEQLRRSRQQRREQENALADEEARLKAALSATQEKRRALDNGTTSKQMETTAKQMETTAKQMETTAKTRNVANHRQTYDDYWNGDSL
jgi:hypothetical protein